MLPNEIIYEIFYFLNIDTRIKNKILPQKLIITFIYTKPKLDYYENYIIQCLTNLYIITNLETLETIVIVKNKQMYTYSSFFIHTTTILTNRVYRLDELL